MMGICIAALKDTTATCEQRVLVSPIFKGNLGGIYLVVYMRMGKCPFEARIILVKVFGAM